MNTEDQVKTAGSQGEQTKPSRPDILLLSRYDGRCNIRHQDTRIQTPSGWRSQEWRQDAVDKRSNGHGRVNLIISGYRGGLDTYIRDPHHQATHSVTTLSYTWLTRSPRHQWRSRPIQLPGRHQLQQLPQWFHLRRVSPHDDTRIYNVSRDNRISSVSKCLVTGCEKFVWTVKTEYTLYPTKYLRIFLQK